MPAFNYTREYWSLDRSVSVLFVFIDTTTLAPSENRVTSSSGYARYAVRLILLAPTQLTIWLLYSGVSEAVQSARIDDQLRRIEAVLASAERSRSWVVVVGHYPVFSAGSHGDTTELKTYLLPLLEQYRIDAYFCGHDHLSAHLRFRIKYNHDFEFMLTFKYNSNSGVHYFVAGAGSMTDTVSTQTGTQTTLCNHCQKA